MSTPVWTLYNSETEQTIENLDVPASLASLGAYSIEQLALWFAWHPGLEDWKPVLELPEFASLNVPAKPALQLVPETPAPAPAAPAPVFEEMPIDETPIHLPVGASATDDFGEKTAFNYDPQADANDEITKTVEITHTAIDYPAAEEPVVAAAPSAPATAHSPSPSTPQPAVAPEEDSVHLFWMADSPEGSPTPTSIDEMTSKFRHLQGQKEAPEYNPPAPVVLPPESEHLAAQAETMPEPHDHVTVGKIETPQRQASFPLASSSAPGESASIQEPSGKERRKYPRFDIRYRVIVRNENLTFRTFSRNISLGGVALEMPVPEALLGSECQIYVGNPKTGENIRFSGKLVANRSDSQYFVFLKSSPDSLTKLQKWVESHTPPVKRAI